jgi:hypothetical protein
MEKSALGMARRDGGKRHGRDGVDCRLVTMPVLVTLVMAIGAALQAAVGLGPALFVGPLLALLACLRQKRMRLGR